MGCIFKPKYKGKDGEYRESNVYWIKYYRNGKPYRESTKSRKESDAKRLLKRREGEIANGKLPGIYFDRVKFDELAEVFLMDYRFNQRKSLRRAIISVAHLREYFEGMKVTNITSPRIGSYIEERKKRMCKDCGAKFETNSNCPFCESENISLGAANATINRELAALKRMFSLGVKQNPPKVDRTMMPYIAMLKESNVRKGFFEHGEFVALRDALPAHLKGFATFGYKVGWRHSEIAKLIWSQVDLNNGIVRLEVGETKNDNARTIYLDDELKKIFQEHWNGRKNRKKVLPNVFVKQDGTIKSQGLIRRGKRLARMQV